MSWRRAIADALKIQMLFVAILVFVAALAFVVLALVIVSDEARESPAPGALMFFAVCVAVAAATFLCMLALRLVRGTRKALDSAVENAERVERHRRDALAGGVPGQLSVSAEPGGEMSEPDRAGSVAIVRKERA